MDTVTSNSTYDIPKKLLEEERKSRGNANVRLLEVQPWYHGMLTRLRAESLVRTPGDFLVRDSISSPGNYVVTCYCKGEPLHFQVNRLILPADESIYGSTKKLLYQFEEEQFSSVVDLIEFYQSHKKVITEQSRCVITNPVTRLGPVDESKEPAQAQTDLRKEIEAHYADVNRRVPLLPNKGYSMNTPKNPNLTKRPLPKIPLGQRVVLSEAKKQLHKYSSETGLNRIQEAAITDRSPSTHGSSTVDLTLPRKPTRPPLSTLSHHTSSFNTRRLRNNNAPNPALVTSTVDTEEDAEYCEMDYEAMDDDKESRRTPTAATNFSDLTALKRASSQLRQSKTSLNNLPAAKPPPPLPTRNAPSAPVRDSACVADFAIYDRPKAVSSRVYPAVSRAVNVGNYHCTKLPHDNRPLSSEAKEILGESLHKRTASESALMITHEDCRLLRLLEPVDLLAGVNNGLVVLLLPHGAPVRADLLERSRCTQFTVVVSILSYDDVTAASKALGAWIAIAKELLMELGNIFSFVNIMAGLCCKELDNVSAIWSRLERDQPNSMRDFQSLLVPALDRLRRSGAMPPNATPCLLPYVQPMLVLMESTNTPYTTAFDWKFDDNDFASPMDTLWQWLEMGREWSLVSAEIRAVAKRKYGDPGSGGATKFNPFQTEFFMRYLFGASGATADSAKRYKMIGQLVSLLSKRH